MEKGTRFLKLIARKRFQETPTFLASYGRPFSTFKFNQEPSVRSSYAFEI